VWQRLAKAEPGVFLRETRKARENQGIARRLASSPLQSILARIRYIITLARIVIAPERTARAVLTRELRKGGHDACAARVSLT
jgi:hypothetical protein